MSVFSETSYMLGHMLKRLCKERKSIPGALTFLNINCSLPNIKVCNVFLFKDKNKFLMKGPTRLRSS